MMKEVRHLGGRETLKLILLWTRISPIVLAVPSTINEPMRSNVVHLVHGIFESVELQALRRQNGVQNRPADTGTGKRKKTFSVGRLGTENHLRPALAFLEGSGYSSVSPHTA